MDTKKDNNSQTVLSIVENHEQELIQVKHLVAQLQEMRESNDECRCNTATPHGKIRAITNQIINKYSKNIHFSCSSSFHDFNSA